MLSLLCLTITPDEMAARVAALCGEPTDDALRETEMDLVDEVDPILLGVGGEASSSVPSSCPVPSSAPFSTGGRRSRGGSSATQTVGILR